MPSTLALLTDPNEFFRERQADPSLIGPLVVILLIAAVNVIASILQSRFRAQVFESGQFDAGLMGAVQAITLILVVAGPFVIWLLYAGVFHGVSALFDGEGDFSTTLALVGWGFVPSILGSIAEAAIRYYRFNVRGVEVPSEITMETMQEFSRNLQTGPLVALIAVLGIVFTLWSAFLWTFAVKHARNLTLKQAGLSVAVPVALGLLLTIRSLLIAVEVL
ncbi:Yip1 family protein [Halosimplex salinum]|uniref:Yip1 family protein n=1 Tax=Halosimplex salinum TaxID=1710538 RepID=UPI000F490AD9|nr:Yip1 family protein [Halosimplex salinum]